jgi:hypothetical protein
MIKSNRSKRTLTALSGGLALLVLAGCTTAEADNDGDRRRCSQYADRTGCMDIREHRRDREQLVNQEKALINAEQARENLRMLREIRRKRERY